MANILETAVAASKAGIAVVPVREDGSKQPDVSWKAYEERLPTKEELTTWFHNTNRTGIGFVCGHASGGLELLEFDDPEAIVAFKTAAVEAGLWDIVKRLELGYCETTPGGGIHWLYRVAEPLKNTKLAAKPCPGEPECSKHQPGRAHVMIETRGVGGYVVVAPSHGKVHETGNAYELRAGSVETIPTLSVDERDELFALAQMLDRMARPTAEPRPHIEASAGSGDRPGDDFNRRASWAEVLEPHGWKRVRRIGSLDYWRRPGKQHGNHSATTGVRGGDASADYLYVFSSSTEFDAERGYSKFSAYTLLNYGSGDAEFAEASRALRAQGYGGAYGDVSDLLARGDSSAESAGQAGEMVGTPPLTSSAHVPGNTYRFEHVFPPDHFVTRYVEWAGGLVDAAWEYHEATALVLLSCATPSVRAYLNAHRRGLKANLYLLLVGESSTSRKSTAVDYGMELLEEFMPGTMIADRASPEGFIQDLAARNHTSSIWAPDEFADHYERIKRRDPDMLEILLTLYGSKNYSKNRANKRVRGTQEIIKDSDRIINPNFSILGGTTPTIFSTITQTDVETGMFVRFAFIYPTSKPERKRVTMLTDDMDSGREPLRAHLADIKAWNEAYFSPDIAGSDIKAVFSEKALDILDDFEGEMERQPETILRRLPMMARKVAMLAAVGEAVPSTSTLLVEERHARWAVLLGRKWSKYSLAFQDSIGGQNARQREMKQQGTKVMRYLREHGGRAPRSAVAKLLDIPADEVTKVGETLMDQGQIILERVASGSNGGRPTTVWAITVSTELSREEPVKTEIGI